MQRCNCKILQPVYPATIFRDLLSRTPQQTSESRLEHVNTPRITGAANSCSRVERSNASIQRLRGLHHQMQYAVDCQTMAES